MEVLATKLCNLYLVCVHGWVDELSLSVKRLWCSTRSCGLPFISVDELTCSRPLMMMVMEISQQLAREGRHGGYEASLLAFPVPNIRSRANV